MKGESAHAEKCAKLRALIKFLEAIFDIYSFKQQYVIVKGLFQYEQV